MAIIMRFSSSEIAVFFADLALVGLTALLDATFLADGFFGDFFLALFFFATFFLETFFLLPAGFFCI